MNKRTGKNNKQSDNITESFKSTLLQREKNIQLLQNTSLGLPCY